MALFIVAGNTAGAWTDTAGRSNIPVGVRGSSYRIQVHLGTASFPFDAGHPNNGITVIAKAEAIRVINTGKAALTYEVGP